MTPWVINLWLEASSVLSSAAADGVLVWQRLVLGIYRE